MLISRTWYYATFREAMRRAKKVGVGSIVMDGREKRAVLAPAGAGMALTTLHPPGRVRAHQAYFEGCPEGSDGNAVEAALRLVEALTRPLDHNGMVDPYHAGLKTAIEEKLAALPQPASYPAPVDSECLPDLMEAIRRSLAPQE